MYILIVLINREADFSENFVKNFLKYGLKMKKEENLNHKPDLFFLKYKFFKKIL